MDEPTTIEAEANEVQEEVTDSTEDTQTETTEEAAPVEEVSQEAEPDMVAQAQAQNEALKAELEALKNSDTNIFEQNELLKKELEDAKQLAKMAEENKTLQGQLEAIKKNSLIDGMIASGQITNDLKEWAGSMTFESLQTFAKSAPRARTILDETNPVDEVADGTMEDWKEKQSKSRIL